ncbi:CRISPR-associated protein (Cas_Cmr3) [uncultured archaeon]|nr:CRISPR-associated protein (Cas_Cmr3) [uncultured archaeon]
MTVVCLSIAPHDPIIARDGRPFNAGNRMKGLDWPYPSVLAGSLRTMLGKMRDGNFDKNTILALKKIIVFGPLPLNQNKIYFPAPKDLLVKEENKKRECCAYAIRPMSRPLNNQEDEGCNLPSSDLRPSMLPDSVKDEFKPAKIPAFWSLDIMINWLLNAKGEYFSSPPDPEDIKGRSDFLNLPQKEPRIHVMIDPDLGSSKDSMLFETIGLNLCVKGEDEGIRLAAKIEAEGEFGDLAVKIDCLNTFAGERRLAKWKAGIIQDEWKCPKNIICGLKGKSKVRMVLATPAIFSDGWKPGWIDGWPKDKEPDNWPKGLKLKLVSACTDRWKPISGWCLEKGKQGPKPIRRLVPAGSVYFFEIMEGDAALLAESLWLRSICDVEQDRQDGFGLALWGIWDYAKDETKEEQKQEV